jgi:NADPH-dependent ferric siderophore reductase
MPPHRKVTVEWHELAAGAAPGDAMVDAVLATEVTPDHRVWVAGEAAAATPGAPIGSAGGGSLGDRPAHRLLLAGDETALPAISRILTAAPDDTDGIALIEVAGPEEEQPLPAPAGVTVRWLHRGGTAPGEGTLLADAVAALDPFPGDDVFAWVAAESGAVRTIRADLRGRWGLGRAQHHAIGYWRRGRSMSPAD